MHTAREPMTHRPDVDQPQLDHMLRQAAAAVACPGCPAKTRRTTRRAADGHLEVCCVGCGGQLVVPPYDGFAARRDLPL
mgnify:CR=1 FL=1